MDIFHTGPQAIAERGNIPLNQLELTSIKALLAYTAHDKKVSEDVVREAVISRFGVNDVKQLSAHHYDDVIRFLVDIQAELILH